MMKRYLVFVSVYFITSLAAQAQCTPDPQYSSPGFYPDSATGLDLAILILQTPSTYSETITYVVPADISTFIGPFPATLIIDSVVLTGISGLPQGFSYSCFDAQNMVSPIDGCSFEGGTIGCIGIDGIPDFSDEGIHPISLSFERYFEGPNAPIETFTIDYYVITISHGDVWPPPPPDVSLEENSIDKYRLFPNPASESFTLKGLDRLDIETISITDASGRVVRTVYNLNESSFEMNVRNFETGIYFMKISNGSSFDVVRFVKE